MKNSSLKTYISKKNLSSQWLANLLGVKERQARNYLNGSSVLPSDKLFVLADGLGVSCDELRKVLARN